MIKNHRSRLAFRRLPRLADNTGDVMTRANRRRPLCGFAPRGMRLSFKWAMVIVTLAVLAGCSSLRDRGVGVSRYIENVDQSAVETPAAEADAQAESSSGTAVALEDPARALEIGSGRMVGAAQNGSGGSADDDARDIVLNFQAADIQEVAKVVLGDLLGLNYVVDPTVTGKVTTETSAGLTRAELLPVLEVLLRYNNAAMLRSGDLIQIVPAAKAVKGRAPEFGGPRIPAGHIMRIYPLSYIGVTEMQKILEPILSEGALIYADERRNLLILAGTVEEQAQYRQTVASFDVNWMEGMSVGLFELKSSSPEDVASEIEKALGDESGKLMSGLVRLVEIERLNSLLAISPSVDALREVRRWITRLDVAGDTREPKLYVLRLQNAKAIDVAEILREVFSDDDSPQRSRRQAELAPGNRPSTARSPGEGAEGAAAGAGAGGNFEGVTLSVGADVRVIADETNNALVIMATPHEYELIAAAIHKLDIVPLQVLIEATILEVTLSDSLEYGVEWFFKNGFGPTKQGRGLLDIGAPGIGTLAPAFSYAVIEGLEDTRVVLNALETESNVNILSSPSLMVLDNQTATINVGDEIPVPTSQSVSNLDSAARTVNEIQFRNTGVSLTVTPRVNAGGLVTMEIEQEVSDAIPTTSSDLNAPTIQQRRISTTVAVESGQTIVLGGLIRDTASENESGLPFLRRVPLVGKLFGQTSTQAQRTELLVLITPHSVADNRDARSVTDEYVKKMRALQ